MMTGVINYLFLHQFFSLVFLNIGVSGNSVSILSGLFAILCGVLISYSDPLLILIGSFGYVIFYLLDYVDGELQDIMVNLVLVANM